MKKFFGLSVGAIAVIGFILLARYNPSGQPATNSTSATTPTASTTSPTPLGTPPRAYKDGSYTGQAVDVGYGVVQIQAVISGGKITDIQFISMPSNGHSSSVTYYAEPYLKSEALSAQSGSVDIVSGATSSSQGFIQSLSDALSQA